MFLVFFFQFKRHQLIKSFASDRSILPDAIDEEHELNNSRNFQQHEI